MFNEYYDAKLIKKGKPELRNIKRRLMSLSHNVTEAGQIHIHIIGICGTAMGTFALMLRDSGFIVSGSDVSFWPPMGPLLQSSGVTIYTGWSSDHITDRVDLVVPGNACSPDHIEVLEAQRKGKSIMSMPEIMGEYFVGHADDVSPQNTSLVVAGTHGKTTTSGLLAHMLEEMGFDPTFLIGGVMQSMMTTDENGISQVMRQGTSHQVGKGAYVVFEGDEYDTAFFDARPKFLHYRPQYSIITSLEWDHVDIYENITEYTTAFRHLFEITKAGIIVSNTYPALNALIHEYKDKYSSKENSPNIITYGTSTVDGIEPDIHISIQQIGERGTTFRITNPKGIVSEYITPLYGEYNVYNSAAVLALLDAIGLPVFDTSGMQSNIAHALSVFPGMKRRQEIVGNIPSRSIVVIDDFAHHPTAVAETLKGIRMRFPSRRIVAFFEPRSSTSRRKIFEHTYPTALAEADVVALKVPPFKPEVDSGKDLLNPEIVKKETEALRTQVYLSDTAQALADLVCPHIADGDIIVVMSNGSFDGIHEMIIKQLSA